MSGVINPEAGRPTSIQSLEQSDRNPTVVEWGGTNAGGGQLSSPALSNSRVTEAGAGPSTNAGLVNYDDAGSADGIEDSAESQG
jgi:hypothetical protein